MQIHKHEEFKNNSMKIPALIPKYSFLIQQNMFYLQQIEAPPCQQV